MYLLHVFSSAPVFVENIRSVIKTHSSALTAGSPTCLDARPLLKLSTNPVKCFSFS